jgi:hypothetical protein
VEAGPELRPVSIDDLPPCELPARSERQIAEGVLVELF